MTAAAVYTGTASDPDREDTMTSEKPEANADDTGASEETKRKFREALERKKQQSQGKGTDHLDGDSAIHGAHGPATHQREFRRKSG
ncbi:hypothetical protein GCM10008097_23750 [Mycetocola manganoxydans]|nr:hypothetical protein GCM10008097_23750 [Mycetocola manganoxydans]